MLTGLRGMAGLIVLISHSANQGLLPALFGNGFGQVGVMIFFVLSGFLMAHLYLYKDFNNRNIKAFAFARMGRVLPLFITLIILSYLITTKIYPEFHYRIDSFAVLAKALLFIRAPYEYWTIPIEVQFYVFFIAMWYVFSKCSNYKIIVLLWIGSLLPSVIYWVYLGKILPIFTTYSSAFIIGVSFSLAYRSFFASVVLQKFSNYFGLIFLIFVNLPSLRFEYDLVISKDFSCELG